MTELKEVIEEGVLNDYIDKEYYKALYQDRGSILTSLYDDFIHNEYASVDSYSDTADFIRDFCEHYHKTALYADAPLYLKTAGYAREHGELEVFRSSRELSEACRKEIDDAISKNFDGMHLKKGFEKDIIEKYGRARASYILATTIRENAWDGRYSPKYREWAENIPISESESERMNCCLHSHPAIIDGMVKIMRLNEQEQQNVMAASPINAEQQEEEKDLAENKYLKETARGYKVMSIAQDKNGRNIAVGQRKKVFIVAIGYGTGVGG